MELDITQYVEDSDRMYYMSNSIANLGDNAGPITWKNSQDYAKEYPLLSNREMIDDAREYFRSFGAWENEDVDKWDDDELQALIAQEVASRVRELEMYELDDGSTDWEAYRRDHESGRISGGIYRSEDSVEGTPEDRYFIYIGA